MMALSSQVTVMCGGALLSWKCLNIYLLMGNSELIPYLSLLTYATFSLTVVLSLSEPKSFLTFTLLILFPIHIGGCKQVAVWGSAAYQN